MTPEMVELARRAVACKGWRWMDGMLHSDSERVVCSDLDGIVWFDSVKLRHNTSDFVPMDHLGQVYLPDLTDPATLGCLLALVRELMEEPTGYISWYEGDAENAAGWSYVSETYGAFDAMPTEAEALVVALEDIVIEEDDE